MSVIGTIKSWFRSAADAQTDRSHQAEEGDKPPASKGGDKGGIGATKDRVEEAQKSEQDWKGDG